jgi:glycine cleavage system protein P-like pyridoxal-binding family
MKRGAALQKATEVAILNTNYIAKRLIDSGVHSPAMSFPVSRVDKVYGDRNLVCSCVPMEEYAETA